jgi:IS5 family transposase
MRQKRDAVLTFDWSSESDLKIVRDRREKYKKISALLDRNPEVLDRVHRDVSRLLSQGGPRGRKGGFTSENFLRALVVHQIEGLSYRGTTVLIAESPFLQDFVRLGPRMTLDYTTLCKAYNAVGHETWRQINALMAVDARDRGLIDPSAVRVDTTVVETDIHRPTDSWLCWDSWRVLSRLLKRAREVSSILVPHRFHDRKVKTLSVHIARYASSVSKRRQRAVKKWWRRLIDRVTWIADVAAEFVGRSAGHLDFEILALRDEIGRYLPLVRTVLSTSARANIAGEKVRATERVFSLFEPHTELIRRGKTGKPVEFGHAVMLCQTREKFICGYEVMEHRVSDSALAEVCLDGQEKIFGEVPAGMTADTGFNPNAEDRETLEGRVETLAIPRKLSDWKGLIGPLWQCFRAGIEGTISVLKRAYRLLRCPYRGFKNFASSVGLSIFCHNLVVLADRPDG